MDMMVPKQAGFYGKHFTASCGVRQGDIMSPIIFNIVADAVIRESEAQFCGGDPNRHLLVDALFYADDGALSGEDAAEVQKFLDIYTVNFSRVGLKMNAEKTEAMIMNGGKIRQAISLHAYRRRIEGVGETHRERSLQKVSCELCGAEVKRQNLKRHQTARKCISDRNPSTNLDNGAAGILTPRDRSPSTNLNNGAVGILTPEPALLPQPVPTSAYSVSMDGHTATSCPAGSCMYRTEKRNRMRGHFRNMHNQDTIVIEEEGQLPRCTECGIFQRTVDAKHKQTEECLRWSKIRKDRETAKAHSETVKETVFTVNGAPIRNVSEFKYLGRVVESNDNDGPAVNRNLTKARVVWGRLGRILSQEGTNPTAMASVYKAVVQAVLLYGSESWVLTLAMEKKLQSFHRRCARFITGQHI